MPKDKDNGSAAAADVTQSETTSANDAAAQGNGESASAPAPGSESAATTETGKDAPAAGAQPLTPPAPPAPPAPKKGKAQTRNPPVDDPDALVQVFCKLPNVGDKINGVEFANRKRFPVLPADVTAVSEPITQEVARHFLSIPGYFLAE